MIRPDMAGLPQYFPPDGYSIRTYRPGDEASWTLIHEKTYNDVAITLEDFQKSFGYDLVAMEDRGFFLETSKGEVVGTATAWYEDDFHDKDFGLVHWVAIIPEHQGKGLSKALMTRVMNRLAQSHDRAMLRTSAERIPAIHLYLNYGFRPLYYTKRCPKEWDLVRGSLSHRLLDDPPLTPPDIS